MTNFTSRRNVHLAIIAKNIQTHYEKRTPWFYFTKLTSSLNKAEDILQIAQEETEELCVGSYSLDAPDEIPAGSMTSRNTVFAEDELCRMSYCIRGKDHDAFGKVILSQVQQELVKEIRQTPSCIF